MDSFYNREGIEVTMREGKVLIVAESRPIFGAESVRLTQQQFDEMVVARYLQFTPLERRDAIQRLIADTDTPDQTTQIVKEAYLK